VVVIAVGSLEDGSHHGMRRWVGDGMMMVDHSCDGRVIFGCVCVSSSSSSPSHDQSFSTTTRMP